jgi:hypothetical protein
MNLQVGQSEPRELANDHNSKCPENCCKNASAKLLDDTCRLLASHADCHFLGNRLSNQSAFGFRQGLRCMLEKYEIKQKQ